jgi:Domain of unknown function (DUF4915)
MRKDRLVAFVVSCFADGLFLVEGSHVERLDRVPSAGLAAAGSSVVARAIHEPAETSTTGRILRHRGSDLCVEDLRNTHELAWNGDLLACVSTLENAVLWIDSRGRVVRRWQAPGQGDCWHLSGIAAAGDRVLVSAFGRFGGHRDWAEAERDGAGFVLELPSGRPVVRGLSSPHSPRLVAGRLAVCDSGRGDLVVGSRRVSLGGWTRGVAVAETELAVGVSVPRGGPGQAHLAVLRRDDLRVVRRVSLPGREIFDVIELAPDRARALARPALSPPPMRPLPPADLRARIEPPSALRLAPGALATVSCALTNLGSSTLAGSPPHPVSVVASWRPEGRALWSPLPCPLEPGERSPVPVRVLAPPRRGRYELELRVVQEGVAWLDGGARVAVTVQ